MRALQEYYKIINFRLENKLPKNTYGEWHHIKPKSIYPDLENDPNNIVKLTAEEHYKCHSLLPYIYKEIKNKDAYEKMLFAWHLMAVSRKDLSIDEQAEEYARLREEFRKAVSEANSGENHPMYGKHLSEETRKKISKAMSGENAPWYGKHLSEETKQKMRKPMAEEHKQKLSKANSGENHPMYGKHHSEETREKMSKAKLGKNLSAETKQKLRLANLGENNPRYGKHLSEETKKKMRLAAKKRWERYHQQKQV